MPRSRNVKLFVNGKAVRSFNEETGKTGRVVAAVMPRKEYVAPVENNIVIRDSKFPASRLTGKAIRMLGTKLGRSFFRKDLVSGAVSFQANDPNVLAVHKKLKQAMFL